MPGPATFGEPLRTKGIVIPALPPRTGPSAVAEWGRSQSSAPTGDNQTRRREPSPGHPPGSRTGTEFGAKLRRIHDEDDPETERWRRRCGALIRLEPPGWGKVFRALRIGDEEGIDAWEGAPTRTIRGKLDGYQMASPRPDQLGRADVLLPRPAL